MILMLNKLLPSLKGAECQKLLQTEDMTPHYVLKLAYY